MGIKDELERFAKGKNTSYSIIANYLIGRKSYIGLKLKDVSKECHVSGATIVRFCHSLGYDGFLEMKYRLINDLQKDREQFESNLHIQVDNSIYHQMLEDACKTSESLFTWEKQERFLELLEESKEIILLGLGTSYLMAKDFEIRFGRLGLRCRAIEDIIIQKFTIKNVEKDSLVIVFCYSGTTEAVMENFRMACARNAKVILWTCDTNTQFESRCDLVIYVHSSEPNHLRISTTSRIAILYMIDILYYAYINRKNLHVEDYMDI